MRILTTGQSVLLALIPLLSAAGNAADFERALEYLDMRNLPAELDEYALTDVAWGLAVVIQRELLLNLEELSDDPDGAAGDGLPAYRDAFGRISADGKDYVFRCT